MTSGTLSSDTSADNQVSYTKAAFICGLAAMFYLYEFILQVSPNVMTHDLMRDLKMDAADLGIVSTFYYCAYTPMQLPAGILYDRFGARRIISMAIFVCSLGALLFGVAHGMTLASLGRACMGMGSAFSFIGALVLIARWYPPHLFALLAGGVQLLSSVGAIMGESPLAVAINFFGWRVSMTYLGFIGFALALLVYTFVRDFPPGKGPLILEKNSGDSHIFKNLRIVCSNLQTWWIGLYSFCSWAPVLAFAGLWGTPYLVASCHITDAWAAGAVSMIWLGIGLGSPIIGWWSDRTGLRCKPLEMAAWIGFLSAALLLCSPTMPLPLIYVTLFLFGAAASGQSLSFGVVKDINRPHMVGTAIGFNNMAVVAGGFFQFFIGFILRFQWNGMLDMNNVPVYQASDYRLAFIIIPLTYLIGALVARFKIQETHCKAHYE